MHLQEEFLYHIWDEGHLAPSLKTASGKPIRIIYPGQYNTNRGPDFINAVIEIDNENFCGSIEIHLNSYDWKNHNHHEDSHYNNVILHASFDHNSPDPFTIKENGELAEILVLKDQLSEDISKLVIRHDKNLERQDYCPLLSLISSERLEGILSDFGRKRFLSKVKRYGSALLFSDFEQILYEGMMEAMGYDKNKYNLLLIAQTLSWEKLKAWFAEGMSAEDLISIFLVSTNLTDFCEKQLDKSEIALIKEIYEAQSYFAQRIRLDWQLFRIRPANHPVYRLISIAAFLHEALSPGLMNLVLSIFDDVDQKPVLMLQRILNSRSQTSRINIPKIGRGVTSNIFLNIILPVAYLYYDKLSQSSMKERILAIYKAHTALAENRITGYMQRFLSGKQATLCASKAIYQQGLIELYHKHCQYHFCDECLHEYQGC